MAKKNQKSIKQLESALKARKARLEKYQAATRTTKEEIGKLNQELRKAKIDAKNIAKKAKTKTGGKK